MVLLVDSSGSGCLYLLSLCFRWSKPCCQELCLISLAWSFSSSLHHILFWHINWIGSGISPHGCNLRFLLLADLGPLAWRRLASWGEWCPIRLTNDGGWTIGFCCSLLVALEFKAAQKYTPWVPHLEWLLCLGIEIFGEGVWLGFIAPNYLYKMANILWQVLRIGKSQILSCLSNQSY